MQAMLGPVRKYKNLREFFQKRAIELQAAVFDPTVIELVGSSLLPKTDLKSSHTIPEYHGNNMKMPTHGLLRLRSQSTAIRGMATQARSTLKIALLPADGIGKEVIPVRVLYSPDPSRRPCDTLA